MSNNGKYKGVENKYSGNTKCISGFRKYFDAVASLHDVMMIANELEKEGKLSPKGDLPFYEDSVELLEYILHTYFGFDKEVVMFENYDDEGNKIFHWYSAHHCTHRSKLTGEVVRMDRYIGAERVDKGWYDTGMMSTETWGLYKGV